ncbi:MAG: hypothetical protein BalsKO_12280 [Balneolaceae bacterium]
MKNYIFISTLLLFSSEVIAQSIQGPPTNKFQDTRSTFYIELGGNAIFGSVNYDLTFDSKYGVRIGVSPGLFLLDNSSNNYEEDFDFDLTALISAFKLFGSDLHKFETGIGVLFGDRITPRDKNYPAIPALALNLGYRFISTKEKGISFRGMFTPSISKNGLITWVGISLGYSFKNKAK